MCLARVQVVLISALLVVQALHQPSARHDSLQRTHMRKQPLIPILSDCRWVCDNDTNYTSSTAPNNGPSKSPSEPPITPPNMPSNCSSHSSDLGENPSPVGILLNRTGDFNGYINNIFHLSDIIEKFPNSSGILLSSPENLRNNQNLRLLLHLIGVPNGTFASENHTLSEWLNQYNITSLQWQEIYQRLPFLSGIFSTPFGTVFQPFPFNMSPSTFSDFNNNPSEGFSRLANSFSQLPYLSGIFMRPQEVSDRLHGLDGAWQNSSSIFFGPEGGYDILQRILNRTSLRNNLLQLPTIAPSFLNSLPMIGNMAKQWNENANGNVFPGLNSGAIPSMSDITNILSAIRGGLKSQSEGNGVEQGPFTVHDLPNLPGNWLGNNTSANMTQWYSILNSLSSSGEPYNEQIANFLNHKSLPNISSGISDSKHLLDSFGGGLFPGFSSMSTPAFLEILNGVRTIFNDGALTLPPPPISIEVGKTNERIAKHHEIAISNKTEANHRNSKIGGSNVNHRTDNTIAISKNHHQSGKHSETENLKSNKHQEVKHAKVNPLKSQNENSDIIGKRKVFANVKSADVDMDKQKSRHKMHVNSQV